MMRHARVAIVLAAVVGAAATIDIGAEQLDRGLVTALDRIGGNLLGTKAFDAVLLDPPDNRESEVLRIYLSEAQTQPVEIVLVTGDPPEPVGESTPLEPVRAFFRMTVGGPEGLKLEFDSSTGEIVPCVLPPDDLSGLGAAPSDSNEVTGRLRPGLVTAFGEVGANLLGPGAFDAVLGSPPDPVTPQSLRLVVSKSTRIEFVLTAPPEPIRPVFRMVVGGAEVELQLDWQASTRGLQIEDAKLGGLVLRSN